jgi:NAD-dependent deacetylase
MGESILRPDIVWFGEMPFRMEVIEACLARATHFISIGTSRQVYPASGFLSAASVVPGLVDELISELA